MIDFWFLSLKYPHDFHIQMGIDGNNFLEVRGSKEDLDTLESSGFVLKSDNKELVNIAERFFSSSQFKLIKRTPTFLYIGYEFRNYPIYEYLYELLVAYPKCWMKNTFTTETGTCGVWIGRTVNGIPHVEQSYWRELTYEEIEYVTDFSK